MVRGIVDSVGYNHTLGDIDCGAERVSKRRGDAEMARSNVCKDKKRVQDLV